MVTGLAKDVVSVKRGAPAGKQKKKEGDQKEVQKRQIGLA